VIGTPRLLTDGCRYRILTDFDTAEAILAPGHWFLVWDVKFGKAQVRAKCGPSKKEAKWMSLPNDEGLRIQTMSPRGNWR